LLLVGASDVAGVGYSGASQFRRESRRPFGEPPGRDAEQMRREPVPAE